jgi:hypothetical protein
MPQEKQPPLWTVIVPLLPWAALALAASLFLRRWGYARLPWLALGLVVITTMIVEIVLHWKEQD